MWSSIDDTLGMREFLLHLQLKPKPIMVCFVNPLQPLNCALALFQATSAISKITLHPEAQVAMPANSLKVEMEIESIRAL